MRDFNKSGALGLLVYGVLFCVALTGCERAPHETPVPAPSPETAVLAESALLGSIVNGHSPTSTDPYADYRPAYSVVFDETGRGVAYVARIGEANHVVFKGKVGAPTTGIDQIRISPDGQRVAYSAMVDGKWRMFIDGAVGLESDEVGDPVFSPDSKHIAYWGKLADKWFMSVDGIKSERDRGYVGEPIFSADSSRVAYVEQVDDQGGIRLVVSDLALKALDTKAGVGAMMRANAGQTRIAAVSGAGGRQRVIEFSFAEPATVKAGPEYDAIVDMAFGADGVSVAYIAEQGGKRFIVLNGHEEPVGEGRPAGPPVVRPDGKAVGIIMATGGEYYFHQAFADGGDAEEARYSGMADFVYSSDGAMHAYTAQRGNGWFVVVNGHEGPSYDIVVTPSFSPDGKRIVYRARKDGKRFVVVADAASGKVTREHPAYEQVFPVVFTPDGKSVAYGAVEGRQIFWKVEGLD